MHSGQRGKDWEDMYVLCVEIKNDHCVNTIFSFPAKLHSTMSEVNSSNVETIFTLNSKA